MLRRVKVRAAKGVVKRARHLAGLPECDRSCLCRSPASAEVLQHPRPGLQVWDGRDQACARAELSECCVPQCCGGVASSW